MLVLIQIGVDNLVGNIKNLKRSRLLKLNMSLTHNYPLKNKKERIERQIFKL